VRPYLGHSEPRVHAPADAAPIIICPGRRSMLHAGHHPALLQVLHQAALLGLSCAVTSTLCNLQASAMRPTITLRPVGSQSWE
jgi:hypothetical protein